jgi:hydroxymethylglutaryl-CoA reductase
MSKSSRIPGFYRLSLDERRACIAEASGVSLPELVAALGAGGLDAETADKVVENALGIYGLPFGIALNVRINNTDRLVPMVVEEPSVIAAASNAARMVRASGGFSAEIVESLMTGQIQLFDVPDAPAAVTRLENASEELLALAAETVPGLTSRGGGPRAVEVRDLGQRTVVVHVLVDCCDAMGANQVNTIAEALGPRVAELGGGSLGLRILSNLCDRRRVRATCRVHARELVSKEVANGQSGRPPSIPPMSDDEVVARIVEASRFAELDPYRAATHNKGIMNGVDAVVIATGNDFRAVEAGAHAYAARSGRYAPLAVWRRDGEDLTGELEMPLALGTVGGTLRVHPVARIALALMGVDNSADLAMIAASIGLASNLAALRALATEGIQRGHMSLHARSVAATAGAVGAEVEHIADRMASEGLISLEAAQAALATLRGKAI